MRKQFFVGRFGRRIGSVLGVALAALIVHWVQGYQQRTPVPTSATQQNSTTGGAVRTRSPAPTTTAVPDMGAVPAGSYTLKGVVSRVADGDTVTLTVNGQAHRVRLDSIDAPEASHSPKEPGQPFAEASQQYLRKLVEGKTLTAQCYQHDQYDRDLCALILPDGNSANRVMVASGYAWAYTARRGAYLRDMALPALQDQARQAGSGLWAQGGPTEPWKWRYECWRNQRCTAP